MAATKERFNVAFQLGFDLPADDADLRALENEMADDYLAREGGRRVSEWTWATEAESPSRFESYITELRERIGQPWDDDDPKDIITAEEIERIKARGPATYRFGKCWAVRA